MQNKEKIYTFEKNNTNSMSNVFGYIYSDKKIRDKKEYIEYINDLSDYDASKPLLIIGIENARSFSDKFSILNKKLDKNIFWTFSRTENREEYNKDIDSFYKYTISIALSNIRYFYINFIKLKYGKIKKFLNMMYDNTKKCVYINKKMAYIRYNDDIFGISFDILEYCGIKRDKIVNKIIKSKKFKIIFENKEILDKINEICISTHLNIPLLMLI